MILSQEEKRKKLLKEALKAELRSAAKDLLEEIALAERKLSASRTKMFVMAITPEAWMGCSAR